MVGGCLLIREFAHRFGKKWISGAPDVRFPAEPCAERDLPTLGDIPGNQVAFRRLCGTVSRVFCRAAAR